MNGENFLDPVRGGKRIANAAAQCHEHAEFIAPGP